MKSKFLELSKNDFVKGLALMLIFTAVTSLYEIVNQQRLPNAIELQKLGIELIKVFLAYILKALVTNKDGVMLKKD